MMFKDVQNDVQGCSEWCSWASFQLGIPAGGVGCEDVIWDSASCLKIFGGFIQTMLGSPLPGSLKVIFWDSSLIWSSSIKMASEWVQNQCFQLITNYIFLESSCNLWVSCARKKCFLEPNLVVGARQILQNGFRMRENTYFQSLTL